MGERAPRISGRRSGLIAKVLWTMAAIAGCAGAAQAAPLDLAALEAAARKEGAVTYYTVQTAAVNEAMTRAFKARYGIDIKIFNAPTTAMKTRVQSEIDVGRLQADIVGNGEHTIIEKNSAIFSAIEDLPAFADYPARFKTPIYAVTSIQHAVLVVNTDKVKPGEITGWTDLANPKWAGQIAMLSIRAAISTSSLYVDLGKRYGDDFLRKVAAQRPSYQASSSPTAQLVAAGEAAAGFPIAVSVLPALIKAGAPIAVIPTDPLTGAEISVAIAKAARSPSAARLLLNFMMTREGQEIQNGGQLGASPLPGVTGAAPLPAQYTPADEGVSQNEIRRVGELLGSP